MPWELVLVVQIRKLVLKSEEQLERLKEQTKALSGSRDSIRRLGSRRLTGRNGRPTRGKRSGIARNVSRTASSSYRRCQKRYN